MTERLDDIVGEMRTELARLPFPPEVAGYADRILAAAALERAEHRRQLDEALAPPTEAELDAVFDEVEASESPAKEWDDTCAGAIIASRRARMVKEG